MVHTAAVTSAYNEGMEARRAGGCALHFGVTERWPRIMRRRNVDLYVASRNKPPRAATKSPIQPHFHPDRVHLHRSNYTQHICV
jgi:hypothetical protein